MRPSANKIRETSFTPVRRGGVDAEEVASFVAAVSGAIDEVESELASLRAEVTGLRGQDSVVGPSRSGSVVASEKVAEILGAAERTAERTVAEARAEAQALRSAAAEHDRTVRREADEYRRAAEVEVDAFRTQTVEHAARLRADADADVSAVRAETESHLLKTRDEVINELTERVDAVSVMERTLLERLSALSWDVDRAIGRLRDVGRTGTEEAASTLGATDPRGSNSLFSTIAPVGEGATAIGTGAEVTGMLKVASPTKVTGANAAGPAKVAGSSKIAVVDKDAATDKVAESNTEGVPQLKASDQVESFWRRRPE